MVASLTTPGTVVPTLIVKDREGNEHCIEAASGLKVMEVLRDLENGVTALWRGMCSCATCHVHVDRDWIAKLPVPTPEEQELIQELPRASAESRQSCQILMTEELSGLRLTVIGDD